MNLSKSYFLVFLSCLSLFTFKDKQCFSQKVDHNKTSEDNNSFFTESSFSYSGTKESLLSTLTIRNQIYKLQSQRASSFGNHYLFELQYLGKAIYGASLKINCDKQDNVISYFSTLPKIESILETENTEFNAWFCKDHKLIPVLISEFYKDGLLYRKISSSIDHSISNIILLSSSAQDSIASLSIFLPNPIISAQTNYGFLYSDNNDASSITLNNEIFEINMKVKFENGQFKLENEFVKLTDISLPNNQAPILNSPVFDYNRSESEFEEVNAYYHINAYKAYLNSIGLNHLANEQLLVDVHGNNGDDNSFFTPSNTVNESSIMFGDGGVDDGEDAHVIIHEYGHFIAHTAAPGTNTGLERNGLDEGLGDYLASSYSKSISNYRFNDVFSWDGHNEYWEGRNSNTNKTYEDINQNFYSNAEIWSSCLMDINEDIGREATDVILMESLFGYAPSMTMTDAAKLMVQTDSILNNTAFRNQICARFSERGLYECPIVNIDSSDAFNLISVINTDRFAQGGNASIINNSTDYITIDLYSMDGRLIKSLNKLSTNSRINLQSVGLSYGGYIIRITLPDGNEKSYKLVKQTP